MLLSELIDHLTLLQGEYGDGEVWVDHAGLTSKLEHHSVVYYSICEVEQMSFRMTEEEKKRFIQRYGNTYRLGD